MEICEYGLEVVENGHSVLCKKEIFHCDFDTIKSSRCFFQLLNNTFRLGYQAEERIYLIAMNTKNQILGLFMVSHGTVNKAFISPREVLVRALLCGATNIVLAHNHPSQNVQPSKADLDITKRIAEASALIGIPLLDHLIVSVQNYYSFYEAELLPDWS